MKPLAVMDGAAGIHSTVESASARPATRRSATRRVGAGASDDESVKEESDWTTQSICTDPKKFRLPSPFCISC